MLNELCEVLGVEVGKEWKSKCGNVFEIENNRLYVQEIDNESYMRYVASGNDLVATWKEASPTEYKGLVTGEIIPLWEPEVGEEYYTVDYFKDDSVALVRWKDHPEHHGLLNKGLVCKSYDEAKLLASKMIDSVGLR